MSRSQNSRHSVINQVTGDMAWDHIPPPLPSQSALAEMYNISRTTVRHTLSHLREYGVLAQAGNGYVITRKPDRDNDFACTAASTSERNRVPEQAFFATTSQRRLRPGETFSELQLVQATGVSPVVVGEYLLKFGRYNPIQGKKRGQWSMRQFDQPYAEQLFELREVLETHSLRRSLNPPDHDSHWLQVKTMLERHRLLHGNIGSSFRMFSQPDRDFHSLLFSAADNIFFDQSSEIISVIFHFHYQWDENNLRQHNTIAVDGHMTALDVLIRRSNLDTTLVLRSHLNSAKQPMIRSTNENTCYAHQVRIKDSELLAGVRFYQKINTGKFPFTYAHSQSTENVSMNGSKVLKL